LPVIVTVAEFSSMIMTKKLLMIHISSLFEEGPWFPQFCLQEDLFETLMPLSPLQLQPLKA